MKCAICLQVYQEPIQLPCFHFFCQACLRLQITNQKTVDVMPRCAECNVPFNRRQTCQNKKFNSILEVYKSIRQANNLCTQMPQMDLFMANNQRRVENFKLISARLKQENAAAAAEAKKVEVPKTAPKLKGEPPIVKVEVPIAETTKKLAKAKKAQIEAPVKKAP